MMALSEMTRRRVTVSLSGDGGDELFAGYPRYRAVQLGGYADRLPGFARRMLSATAWQRLPAGVSQKSRRRRLKRLLSAIGDEPRLRYLTWVSVFDRARREDLYTPEFRGQLHSDAADFLLTAYGECPGRDFVTQTTCADVLTYLPCDILTKVDIASMAYGLECRCPFLDQRVVDFAARLPIERKLQGGRSKRILTEAFGDLLPLAIQRRSKMGFGVPLGDWFRGELKSFVQEVLLDPQSLGRGYFRPAAVEKLIDEHLRAEWDHSARLWALLCLELWERMFLDAATGPSNPPLGRTGEGGISS
jgi:asparagine synthase (glutamine-hydrolysing)